jgi:(1->4)-alpha-D-glucan 1-alpha-D-glucosylmutase
MACPAIPRIPDATYRLQFREGMTFDRAIGLIPHLQSIGISHLYASPIFTAVAGSTHGYDVTDPNALDPELGGMAGFRRLSEALLASGIGLIVDIVPNHMAASLENEHWRNVLKWGRRSPSAAIFDTDWSQPLTLPVLAETPRDAIAAGHGRLVWSEAEREIAFDYRGSRYPLHPETYASAIKTEFVPPGIEAFATVTSPEDGGVLEELLAEHFRTLPAEDALLSETDDIVPLLERQCWRLIHWQDAAKGMSYRRFFEITGLVGVRVEDPAVFTATHRLILDLVAEGRVQGLRVDHIDGLADPAGYLARLRQAVGPDVYLVIEKILEGEEQLPADWPVQGTTGYEFISDLAGLLTRDAPALDRAWREIAPDFDNPEQELRQAKRLMIEVNFEGEVRSLIDRAAAIAVQAHRRDIKEPKLAEAMRALIAEFDVYRTYGTAQELPEQDRVVLDTLFGRLIAGAPDLAADIRLLADILFLHVPEDCRVAALEFRTRLQHLTGPVLAKSLEDTFFYRYNRLIALNEVGGDPIGQSYGLEHFHARMTQRHAVQPHGLSATSTHDTKRGEDARARLYAISEAPEAWTALVARWRGLLTSNVAALPDGAAPEPAVEWMLFQALAGMLPPDFDSGVTAQLEAIKERFLPYVEKALREAKRRSNWSDVNAPYETAVKDYAAAAIGSDSFMAAFWDDIAPFVRTGMVNSLTQTLIKLTVPGIPDIYQGTEGADMSLVDPDNRGLLDHEPLATSRGTADPGEFVARKAWLIARGLNLRRQHPDLFAEGDYIALEATGARRENVIAYARRLGSRSVAVVAPRLVHDAVGAGTLQSRDYWGDTSVVQPSGMRWGYDMFAENAPVHPDGELPVSEIFRERPFALFIDEG